MKFKLTAVRLALAVIPVFFAAQASADNTAEARKVLDFCIAHPDNCSLSIDHLTNNWEIHYHGNRLNVVASMIKMVPLIAYGEAVNNGTISPQTQVGRDTWTRFWIGLDGGALNNAYARFSATQAVPPEKVMLSQIVSAMLRESDNAAPDFFLSLLGSPAMQNVIDHYIAVPNKPGYIDTPKSINSTFISWLANPDEPASGHRNVGDYSGFESFGYRSELDGLFQKLQTTSFVKKVRQFVCSWTPWSTPLIGCQPGVVVTEPDYRTLTDTFFMRSNTLTYNQLMAGLLRRDLLPPGVQQIIEPFLEWRLSFPQYSAFNRYGAKGGSLGTYDGLTILTGGSYAETRTGKQAVATIQLQGPSGNSLLDLGSLQLGVAHFVDALVQDPAFEAEVRQKLGPLQDTKTASLVARITDLKAQQNSLDMTVKITNIGTAVLGSPFAINLYLSNDHNPSSQSADRHYMGPLNPGESTTVALHTSGTPVDGKFAVLLLVPGNAMDAIHAQNNPQWERIHVH